MNERWIRAVAATHHSWRGTPIRSFYVRDVEALPPGLPSQRSADRFVIDGREVGEK
jgi:hypothetical protein